ncbi:MAG: DUF1801 domain-containing protein [Tannerellaceae bacterium]|nr:DUF1801 domain-containing protein [Tannerellaceae bacterium]
MKEDLTNFYLEQEEPQKSTLLALRSIILGFDSHISETQKYGMPCFLYKKNIFCYLWTDKKTAGPYILMAEGNYLDNPALEQGTRARMKIMRINPEADIPIQTIGEIFKDAIDLYQKGIVKLK